MNKDSFLSYIEKSRDCEEARLDAAIKKGLYKAKNDQTDFRKLLALAAACALTFAMFFSINLNLQPINSVVEEYYQSRAAKMAGSSEALEGYIRDITGAIEFYLGGK
jgi:hypothetical protein